MGQGSSYFTKEEQDEILAETNLNARYLQEIQKRYSQLDISKSKDETSGVTITGTLQIPEIHQHKIASLLAEKYGGRQGIMYPRDFVDFFSILSSKKPPSEKVDVLFELLDVKKFGYLGPIEMYRYYHLILSPSLSNKQIETITKNAINVAGDKIDLKKFHEIMPAWQVVEKMTVELQMTD